VGFTPLWVHFMPQIAFFVVLNLLSHCSAGSLGKLRLKSEWKTAISQNRLSSLASHQHRATAELAQTRNQFTAEIVVAVFIAYANPSGRTIAFAQQVLAWGKPLFTLNSANDSKLIEIGAKSLVPSTVLFYI
jgi:hypothetical protein